MNEDDLYARLRPLLTRHTPCEGDFSIAGEMREIMVLPPKAREEVVRRLEAVDRFSESPGASTADAEAMKLGMKRRNFYNLISKVKSLGPARALAPRPRNYSKKSHLAPELGDMIEAVVAEILVDDPEAPLKDIVGAVHRECDLKRVKSPSDATISARVSALRSGRGDQDDPKLTLGDGVFGREFLIDVSAASLWLHVNGRLTLARICFVIDVGTRLICAIGVGPDPDAAFRSAWADLEPGRRLPIRDFETKDWPETVRWIAPDHYKQESNYWSHTMGLNDVLGLIEVKGARRFGVHATRLLGTRLGWLRLYPRLTSVEDAAPAKGDQLPILEHAAASEAVVSVADEWNYEIGRKRAKERRRTGLAREAQFASWLGYFPEGLRLVRYQLETVIHMSDL